MAFYHKGRSSFHSFLRAFLQDDCAQLRQALTAEQIERAATEHGVSFGNGPKHIYSVSVTLWTFVVQAVSESRSCAAAVKRLLATLMAAGRKLCSTGTSAYCKARAKLPESFLRALTCEAGANVETQADHAWRWHGRRVVLVDGSTLSMPDTPENQAEYPQPRTQRPGVGFPILRWVGLFGLATATVLDSAFGPYSGKETGETALFRKLLSSLKKGDVVLADRYHCGYFQIAMLIKGGHDVVIRKQHLRRSDFRRGRRLGRNDHVITWTKLQRPKWMDEATYQSLPEQLILRETRGQIHERGSRVEEIITITTLLDPVEYPKEEILDLYHQRWHVETDLSSIKTQMRMDILTCKTPEMVRKEIWARLLAYNLVRGLMAQAASKHNITPRRLSFKGALDTINEFRPNVLKASAARMPEWKSEALDAIARHKVGNRPGRVEPRKVKRRPKSLSYMLKTRAEERAELQKGGKGRHT